jgi:transposase
VIDEKISVLVQEKVPNELPCIIDHIEPYKETLEVVVESSFNWYWLVDGLQEAGYEICLAHPFGLYMITGAKVKTDRRDAFALAKLLRAGVIPKAYIYPKEHTRSGMKQAIEDDIDMWFKDPMIRLHAHQELKRIWIYTSQIRELERATFHCAKDRPEYSLLVLVPGIGKILAMTILYEIGEILRFKSAREFSSYCRLVPGIAQSGGSSKRGRGSKQGNHYLKWAFNQAAMHAVRSSPKIRRSYDRHLRRHRGRARKLIACNIIAHRLAQAVYYILRDGSEYKEELLFGT